MEQGRSLSLLLVAGLLATKSVHAAPTDEADALFEEGRKLLEAGQLAAACPKLERSFQLAPRLGVMLNLGTCFERRGQLARAQALYERAATLARQQGRSDREAAAREYAALLEPKIAKLLLVIDEPSAELVTQVDGEQVSTRSGLIPLDPGQRKLIASLPGKKPFSALVTLVAGKTTTLHVPKLADEPAPAPAAATAGPAAGPEPRTSGARTAAIVTSVALGAVGVGLGSYFGLRAKSKNDDSKKECDDTGCTDAGLSLISDAKSAGNIATVAFIAGGVALATTVVILLWPTKPSSASAARITRAATGTWAF